MEVSLGTEQPSARQGSRSSSLPQTASRLSWGQVGSDYSSALCFRNRLVAK
jgi:hypothetical protein